MVTIMPDGPSQWKPRLRPGLPWGFSLSSFPLASLSSGHTDTSPEGGGVQAPGNWEPVHGVLRHGSRVALKSPHPLFPEGEVWESPAPALECQGEEGHGV